jgi:hypothetical protein
LRLVTHAGATTTERPPLLSEVVQLIAAEPYPTLLELDLKDWNPWPWPRVEELARMLQPVKDRITFGGVADWNLRRLLHVDPTLPMGFTITQYFDWVPEGQHVDPLPGVRSAYGYLDAHPLARTRLGLTSDYLRDRLSGLLQLVPGSRHPYSTARVRAHAGRRSDRPGRAGPCPGHAPRRLDTERRHLRLARPTRAPLSLGADVITSGTPRELARGYSPDVSTAG